MKKHLIFLAVFVLATGFNAFANPGKMIVKIEKGENAKSINLLIANLQDLRTNIAIEDFNGMVWFDEYVWGETGYAKRLNLNGMPNGDYFILIKNKEEFQARAFTVGFNDIAFFNEKVITPQKRSYASLVSYEPDAKGSLIAQFNNEGEESLLVKLANLQKWHTALQLVSVESGVQLDENILGENGYYKRWDLGGMPTGDYFIYVRSLDTTVMFFFNLEEGNIRFLNMQRLDRPAGIINAELDILSAR